MYLKHKRFRIESGMEHTILVQDPLFHSNSLNIFGHADCLGRCCIGAIDFTHFTANMALVQRIGVCTYFVSDLAQAVLIYTCIYIFIVWCRQIASNRINSVLWVPNCLQFSWLTSNFSQSFEGPKTNYLQVIGRLQRTFKQIIWAAPPSEKIIFAINLKASLPSSYTNIFFAATLYEKYIFASYFSAQNFHNSNIGI